MLRRNVGKLDRPVRAIAGVALLAAGLAPLGGVRGEAWGLASLPARALQLVVQLLERFLVRPSL